MRGAAHTALLLTVIGCTTPEMSGHAPGGWGSGGPDSGGAATTGTVSARWTLPGGEHVSAVTYTLTNGPNSYSGSIGASTSSVISFVVGSVADGSGYTLAVSATSDDGRVHCAGSSAAFDVAGQTTTLVNVMASCMADGEAGAVVIDSVMSNCPIWNTVVASRGTAYVVGSGSTIQLTATARAPDPASMAFQWATGAGTISAAPQSDSGTDAATFTCPTTPGIVPITLIVTDGPLPDGGGCDPKFNRVTFSVDCLPCTFGVGCGDGGQICNAGGACVPALFSVVVLNSIDGGVIDSHGTYLPMSIQNYNVAGAPVGSPIALPTAAIGSQQPITLQGNVITEGDLTTSADGRYLVTTGWNVPPAGRPGLSTNPVVARIDPSGTIDTSTVISGAFYPTLSVRSAVASDGSGFWVSGAANDNSPGNGGGIWYVPFGGTAPTQLVSLPDGVNAPDVYSRWMRIFGGQLYGGFDEAPPYMATVGTGLVTTGSPAVTPLPGSFATWAGATPSPYGFAIFSLYGSGPDTMYIADDGINPIGGLDVASATSGSTGGGGLSKWSYSASSGWSQVWSINAGTWAADAGVFSGAPIGFRGLAGFSTGTTVTLMATTADSEGNPDSLAVVVFDDGSSTPPTPTVVATTPVTQVFRGIALTPQ